MEAATNEAGRDQLLLATEDVMFDAVDEEAEGVQGISFTKGEKSLLRNIQKGVLRSGETRRRRPNSHYKQWWTHTSTFGFSSFQLQLLQLAMDHSQISQEATQDSVQHENSSDARGPTCPRWTDRELVILIEAKRSEHELSEALGKKEKMRTMEVKWREIEAACALQNLPRPWKILKKRWDRLIREFRKVWDFQQKPPSGVQGYFEMDSAERKKHLLPPGFGQVEWDYMRGWASKVRAINPHKKQLRDSSGEEYLTPAASPTEILSPTDSNNDKEVQQDDGTLPRSDSVADADFESMGRRKKQKPTKPDADTKAAMTDFMETMANETKRHNETENAFLHLERIKHFETQTLRMEKNFLMKEAIEKSGENSIRLGGHLGEVAGALRYLVDGLSSRIR